MHVGASACWSSATFPSQRYLRVLFGCQITHCVANINKKNINNRFAVDAQNCLPFVVSGHVTVPTKKCVSHFVRTLFGLFVNEEKQLLAMRLEFESITNIADGRRRYFHMPQTISPDDRSIVRWPLLMYNDLLMCSFLRFTHRNSSSYISMSYNRVAGGSLLTFNAWNSSPQHV